VRINSDPNVAEVQLMNRHGVSDAFGLILQHDLEAMCGWAPVAYENSDCEGIHQMRVSLRRMRSALSVFSRVIAPDLLSPWSDDMRWIANALGPARDMDVFLNESISPLAGKTPFTHGEQVLRELTRTRRDQLQLQLQQTLNSQRYQNFIKEFSKWLENHGWFQWDMPARDRLKMTQSVRDFAIRTLDRRLSKTCQRGKDLASMSDEQLHELRIECKKLRYATDFFSTLFPGDKLRNFVQNLKAIQNILGLMNDVAVLPSVIDPLLEGVSDPEVLRFAGAVFGWRAKGYDDARKLFEMRWSQFMVTSPPWQHDK